MTAAEAEARQIKAEATERQRRADAAEREALDVREIAHTAKPRIKADAKVVAEKLKAARSFHAHRKLSALSLDVGLVDDIIDLLEG